MTPKSSSSLHTLRKIVHVFSKEKKNIDIINNTTLGCDRVVTNIVVTKNGIIILLEKEATRKRNLDGETTGQKIYSHLKSCENSQLLTFNELKVISQKRYVYFQISGLIRSISLKY